MHDSGEPVSKDIISRNWFIRVSFGVSSKTIFPSGSKNESFIAKEKTGRAKRDPQSLFKFNDAGAVKDRLKILFARTVKTDILASNVCYFCD